MMTNCDRQQRVTAVDDRQIRIAAESLFNASINSGRSSYTAHSQLRTPDYLNEALIAGSRYNGRMSNVRRFFCLFVTFDFLFTILMWLICIMISGKSVQTSFVEQIVHYSMNASLFDIVMAAASRFTILLLFYALLHIDHWCIVAISTASTCAFLLTKVFLYDWSKPSQPVFEVLLVLTSFVLVWGEVWFLDIKVIPQESQARDWFLGFPGEPERAPLLSPSANAVQPGYVPSENVGSFYTPIDSPDQSDDEGQFHRRRADNNHSAFLAATIDLKLPLEKVDECRKQAPALLKKCYELIESDNWKVERTSDEGDLIYSMVLPKPDGKIFKISGTVEASAAKLANSLYENIESSTSWNSQIEESKKIYEIDDNTDLIYQATKSFGNGAVGARDFVILRHRGQYQSYFINSGISVKFSTVPNRKNYVRGENGLGCFAVRSLEASDGPSEERCQFVWLLNTNLKGWLPQKVVDMSLSTTLSDFMKALRHHVRTFKD